VVNELDVIACGSIVDNASELLEKKELTDFIQLLRKMYDDIIIDSPPAHLVPDIMIFSHLADSTLYVVKQGLTEKAELDFIKEINENKQLPNLQIVFNGVQRNKYGYGYNYNSNYYTEKNKKILESVFSDFSGRF
jgi:Mrp family chromosome partitioning ATPase